MEFRESVYILSKSEYEKLAHPDVTYTLLTKTAANTIVNNILKSTGKKCIHDDHDLVCDECPLYELFGSSDLVGRVCLRQKRYSWSE